MLSAIASGPTPEIMRPRPPACSVGVERGSLSARLDSMPFAANSIAAQPRRFVRGVHRLSRVFRILTLFGASRE